MPALPLRLPRDTSFSWADRLGAWTSAACFVHCLLTPIVLSLFTVLAHSLPSEERVHRVLAVAVASLGALALIHGFRRHRRRRVVVLMAIGLGCIFGAAWWGDNLPAHAYEVALTFTGSALMISAHRLNHTFCRNCRCAEQECSAPGDPQAR